MSAQFDRCIVASVGAATELVCANYNSVVKITLGEEQRTSTSSFIGADWGNCSNMLHDNDDVCVKKTIIHNIMCIVSAVRSYLSTVL